jgi:acyl-CoA dehydrogenase
VPESSYPMSVADREIQVAARAFVDELLPHEVEAELHDGELPAELLERQRRRVSELGFEAVNMPKELGGGFSAFQQALVQEQVGRATNALGWVIHTPASWLPQVATDEQLERWVLATIRGERRECYAITEEGAGSDVDAIQATAHRDGDGYRLNGAKWHVTSFNQADHVFFQAKLAEGPNAGAHAMFVVDLGTPGIGAVRLGDGRARRRPGGAGVRRPRLHARERRRALLPGAAGGAHLGGHLEDPTDDRRRPARQAGRRPADRIGGGTR